MLHGIVDIEAQLLKIGDDDQPRSHMLALIAKGLRLNLRKVGGLVVFQFDDANHFPIQKYSTIGFLGVGLIFLFGNQIIVGRRIERIAQNFHE